MPALWTAEVVEKRKTVLRFLAALLTSRVSWPETVGPRLVVGAVHHDAATVVDLEEWRTWERLPVPRKTPTVALT